MVTYKAVNGGSLDADLTKVADAIRSETGTTEDLDFPSGFVSEVKDIKAICNLTAPTSGITFADFKNLHITFPNADSIGNTAFQYSTAIASLDFPNAKTIGASAFSGCTSLKNINIPLVTSIGDYSLFGTALTKVDLPVVTSIGASAFQNCGSLTTVIIRSESVPSLGAAAFDSTASVITPIASGTGSIYVPDDLVGIYKEATNWSTYASQIKPLSEYKGN